MKILNDFDEIAGKDVAIYGTGETAEDLFTAIKSKVNTKCFLDATRTGSFLGLPIRQSKKFRATGCDCIVIASCFWNSIIKREPETFKDIDTYILANKILFEITELSALDSFEFTQNELMENEETIKLTRSELGDQISKQLFDYHLKFRTRSTSLKEVINYAALRSDAEQYFEFIDHEINAHVIDAGSHDGTEAFKILSSGDRYSGLHLFEPNSVNLTGSKYYSYFKNDTKTHINFAALGSSRGKAYIKKTGSQSHLNKKNDNSFGDNNIHTISIDEYWNDNAQFDLQFMKMDIEGFEEVAISGGLNTLTSTRPVCAISLYHRKTDLFNIPSLFLNNFENYKYFLRAYTDTFVDTIFYAVPNEEICDEL